MAGAENPQLLAAFLAPVAWDMTRGWLQFETYDCTGNPVGAAGVQVTLDSTDPLVRAYYYPANGGTPSYTATETATSQVGAGGGFVNVPPGVVNLTATLVATGQAFSHAHVIVRAGTLTTVFMFPSP